MKTVAFVLIVFFTFLSVNLCAHVAEESIKATKALQESHEKAIKQEVFEI